MVNVHLLTVPTMGLQSDLVKLKFVRGRSGPCPVEASIGPCGIEIAGQQQHQATLAKLQSDLVELK